MINNRQAGRRRGRGGQRPPSGGGGRPDQGNRIDNRARGNASQLLEKYRNMARDAQMGGDRVATEYYLQFADHYFRVLGENRPRNDDVQQGQQRDEDDEDEGDRFDDRRPAENERRPAENERRPRDTRGNGRDQDERQPEPRFDSRVDPRDTGGGDGGPRDYSANGAEPIDRPRRGRRPRVEADLPPPADVAPEASIADRLPPSIAPLPGDGDDDDSPTPRRRGRRPRGDADSDGAIVAA